ncbi:MULTISPECIES: sulfurtransferase complex subunit TusD [unclassified Marinobacter]|jgi:tRNA 2-thiouridine synthesizing protein D|uniref:sulfurtransferase complex subunit TusD n=1 Tax=unclassified Marinobacter TaxID=83889 RepID=UPI000C93983F|nr:MULTISPECIES: sulfurtransferase complex subunit TusD [unclassified Marinobacter]MAK48988.1 sulfurtransferase complex subunit TusD [Marinobacter sp.]MAK50400.1 sulfurtransferase complex subunit TusD [Marinobacter sp.]|tara:strand:- start:416 stop:820 length:405 start_codon:yes stop_codon:yes gene_type:complete
MSETFTLVITGAPYSSQAPQTALGFAKAAVDAGHQIDRVFLYGDGVHLASALCAPPSDEIHWPDEWSRFLTQHKIPGVACIASALRRGLVNETEQKRYELPSANLRAPFEIAGLGEWVEGRIKSTRTLYFHAGD